MESISQDLFELTPQDSNGFDTSAFRDENLTFSDTALVRNCDGLMPTQVPESGNQTLLDYVKARKEPTLIAECSKYFLQEDNFLKGLKWSPCGNQLLSLSNDNVFRIFSFADELSLLELLCEYQEGGLVYDFCWYPGMNATEPLTCCFASSSKDSSIHLWDSLGYSMRCSYKAYNHVDELTAPYSLSFDPSGERLFCGFKNVVKIFDVSQPGKGCFSRPTFVDKEGQSGIISCFAFNPVCPSTYACGSYSKSIAVYYEPQGEIGYVLEGHRGGVTHLSFSPDGNFLFSGGRKDPEILCWDLRYPGKVAFILKRRVETNQRIYFDLDRSGSVLASGSHDGSVTMWDVQDKEVFSGMQCEPVLPPVLSFKAHTETINSISCHPSLPIVSTGSGQRHFYRPECLSESEDSDEEDKSFENAIKLWRFGRSS